MTLGLSRTILGLLGAARLVRRSVAVASGPLAEAAEEARRKLGLSTRPSLRDGSLVAVPMTFGILRPIVLLPAGARDWPAERLQAVMLHEMGHIKRRDWVTAMLAEVVCALYWFHPLVWLAARQLRAESEQACDDLVLTSGIPPAEYADHLLEVVRGLTKRRGSMPAVVTMACKQDITARIKTILATSKNRSAATGRGLAAGILAALVVVLPLAMIHPVALAQGKVREQAREVNNEQVKKIQPFTGISDLTVGKPQWDQKLADGTRVRLMSVGAEDSHNNIVSYWTPDGHWKQVGDVYTQPSLIYGQRGYECFYAITFASAERQNTAALTYSWAGEQGGVGSGAPPWHKGETIYDRATALFPEGQTKGTVFVHVATGPETTLIAAPPLTGATRHLPTGETVKVTKAVVKLFREQHHLTQTTEVAVALPSRYVQDMSEYSFYPMDWNGKRIIVQHAGSNLPDTTKKMAYMAFDFRTSELPLSRVKEFRFAYRPSHTATFRDVDLQPIASTASTFPSAASTIPSAPTQKDKSDRETSLSNLRLIGLALVRYVADHHERFPDAAHWMDQITPYLVPAQIMGAERQQRIAAIFHDPASPPDQTWTYSFNHALSALSLSQIDNPNMIVAVFESSRGVRNASDSGQSVPQPGRHSGGSDFLFADGHTKWLRAEDTPLLFAKLNPPVIDSSGNLTHLTQPQDTTGWFAPVNPESRQKIPIQGQAYDRRTMKPLRGTFVIFSQSPNKITVGSVWPSSFTNKAGGFQSILYPGKNYLMVLENNRFRFAGKTLNYEANGNKGSIFTQGTKAGTLRSARSDYMVRWTLPQGYSLKASSSPGGPEGANITAFAPIAHSAPR